MYNHTFIMRNVMLINHSIHVLMEVCVFNDPHLLTGEHDPADESWHDEHEEREKLDDPAEDAASLGVAQVLGS